MPSLLLSDLFLELIDKPPNYRFLLSSSNISILQYIDRKLALFFQSGYGVRGGSVNYGGMDDGYVPDYHTGRRISATQYQQQQYEQVHNIVN